jgi:hypothetical protein
MAFGCVDALDAAGYRAMSDMGISVATTMPWVLYGHGASVDLVTASDAMKRFADEVISKV